MVLRVTGKIYILDFRENCPFFIVFVLMLRSIAQHLQLNFCAALMSDYFSFRFYSSCSSVCGLSDSFFFLFLIKAHRLSLYS